MLDRGLIPLIAITYECAAYSRCAYCYTKSRQGMPPMSVSTFRELTAMFQQLGTSTVTLLGGEPTQHPAFPEILAASRADGLRLRVFTNGLFGPRVRDSLMDAQHLDDLFFHFEPSYYAGRGGAEQSYWKHVEAFARSPVTVWLRWNLTATDAPVDELVEHAAALGANIAYSLATPTFGNQSPYVSIKDHQRFRDTVLRLWQKADAAGVRLALGRPLPLCMFREHEIPVALARSDFAATCKAIDDVTINPDGVLQLCSVLHTERCARPRDANELRELLRHLEEREAAIRNIPSDPFCRTCTHWGALTCQGGCLTFKTYTTGGDVTS